MKRILSAILSATLIFSALLATASASASGALPAWTKPGFGIGAGTAYTTRQQITDSGAVEMLNGLIASAGNEVSKPKDAQLLTWIDEDDGSSVYQVLRDGQRYYLYGKNGCRPIAAEPLFAFLKKCGNTIYKYRKIPTATAMLDGEQRELTVKASTYSYRKLDGKFYRPVAAIASPPGYVMAGDTIALLIVNSPEKVTSAGVKILQGGKVLFEGTDAEARAYKLTGSGSFTVECSYNFQHNDFRGDVTYCYDLVRGNTAVTFSIDGNDTYQGEVVVLRAKGVPAGEAINVTTDLTFTPEFYDHPDGDRIALLPVSYLNAVGKHWIEVSAGGVSQRFTVNTQDKKFPVQYLTVGQATAEETILNDRANTEYEKYIAPLRPVSDNVKRWDGRFILPVSDQKVTTAFGTIRYVNGEISSSRHNALDLAIPRGTNVAAAGNGRVLFAGFLQLTGNTVLIEHGYGLKSWYYHMDSLKVKTGDLVKQGGIIGTVGSTGFSTGPHLHFGMSVNNVFINPYTAIQTDLLAE